MYACIYAGFLKIILLFITLKRQGVRQKKFFGILFFFIILQRFSHFQKFSVKNVKLFKLDTKYNNIVYLKCERIPFSNLL